MGGNKVSRAGMERDEAECCERWGSVGVLGGRRLAGIRKLEPPWISIYMLKKRIPTHHGNDKRVVANSISCSDKYPVPPRDGVSSTLLDIERSLASVLHVIVPRFQCEPFKRLRSK